MNLPDESNLFGISLGMSAKLVHLLKPFIIYFIVNLNMFNFILAGSPHLVGTGMLTSLAGRFIIVVNR